MTNGIARKKYTFLVCPLLLFSAIIHADTSYNKELNPFENLYIHDVLYNDRMMRPTLTQLPENTNPWLLRVNVDISNDKGIKFPVEANMDLPWFLVTLYSEINSLKDLEPSLKESGSANFIFGNIYKLPLYARIGYNRMPFGRHYSEVINSSEMVTQQLLKNRSWIVSAGFDYDWSQGQQLSASISFPAEDYKLLAKSQENILQKKQTDENNTQETSNGADTEEKMKDSNSLLNPILNIRYQKRSPIKLARWLNFDRLDIGLGLGIHNEFSSPLFNFNSHVKFATHYNFLFEYSYHSTLNQVGWGSALHTEISRRFSRLPLINWAFPSAFVGGYEFGNREMKFTEYPNEFERELAYQPKTTIRLIPQSNVFAAGKVMLWKQRITVVLGLKLDLADREPALIARLNAALPVS